ncbi:hypothetical protein BJX70DRAFT_368572 [Aspergillus crustosus]
MGRSTRTSYSCARCYKRKKKVSAPLEGSSNTTPGAKFLSPSAIGITRPALSARSPTPNALLWIVALTLSFPEVLFLILKTLLRN